MSAAEAQMMIQFFSLVLDNELVSISLSSVHFSTTVNYIQIGDTKTVPKRPSTETAKSE